MLFHGAPAAMRIIRGRVRREGRCGNASIIAEGRCQGVPAFDWLQRQRPDCQEEDGDGRFDQDDEGWS